ncbi:MAG: hypothetical protein CMB97_01555 [Flavobacteriaceae bacterium]|nr:hypothetical protein [Flavobacteriaceae bacterium]
MRIFFVNSCFFSSGDPGAIEMNWVNVPSDKLFEPVMTLVSKSSQKAIELRNFLFLLLVP